MASQSPEAVDPTKRERLRRRDDLPFVRRLQSLRNVAYPYGRDCGSHGGRGAESDGRSMEIQILKASSPLRRKGDKTRYYSRALYRLISLVYGLTLVILFVYVAFR